MAVNQLSQSTADMLRQYRDEINGIVNKTPKFTGTAMDFQPQRECFPQPQPVQVATPDPRILTGKISAQFDALVKPMQAIEAITEHIDRLETIALKLYVSLDEALESGKAATPNARPRPMTMQDLQNWREALAEYRDFVERIDV